MVMRNEGMGGEEVLQQWRKLTRWNGSMNGWLCRSCIHALYAHADCSLYPSPPSPLNCFSSPLSSPLSACLSLDPYEFLYGVPMLYMCISELTLKRAPLES